MVNRHLQVFTVYVLTSELCTPGLLATDIHIQIQIILPMTISD